MVIFETKIPKEILSNPPKHVGIICDGNGRWGKKRGLPRTAGHEIGMRVAKDITYACAEVGVKFVTMFAFSTENWKRSKDEVNFLMKLFVRFFREWRQEAIKKGIRVNHIGLLDGLSEELKKEIKLTQVETLNNSNIVFNVALNYSGRTEIIAAARDIAKQLKEGTMDINDIDNQVFSSSLFTANQPDLDILIRTGNENRISNFLLWQSSNALLCSLPILWPDFRRKHLWKSFQGYYDNKSKREFSRES
ncbi:polyprenyl diphosphate synthase [Maledivibacter halophilus]|uniref:Isoprenyl transferase n=1 Tax=Maledivibacter halophilus TaxID=36842 RepID=A0A1T5L3F1_9FIRM|nr:polyprenyl diphosphate synthase [Maledivibacter halophilus]SKC70460.1 undecaprenyl diphosphate synthase [Maledivibacter halophilus]